MPLVATPSATTANSYLTDAEFTAYGSGSLASSRLVSSTEGTRERALRTATRMLDRLSFRSEATVYAQSLQWPRLAAFDPDRTGYLLADTKIPRRVQEACAELALALLGEGEASPDAALSDAATYTRQKVDVIEVEFRSGAATATGASGVLQRYPAVWSLISPLLMGNGALQVVRA